MEPGREAREDDTYRFTRDGVTIQPQWSPGVKPGKTVPLAKGGSDTLEPQWSPGVKPGKTLRAVFTS